jgi:hypothetical protein
VALSCVRDTHAAIRLARRAEESERCRYRLFGFGVLQVPQAVERAVDDLQPARNKGGPDDLARGAQEHAGLDVAGA